MDIFTKEKRSEIMSKIKSKDSTIELIVRKYLFAQGIRYRKNDKRYPGKPDIVIPKYKTIIFVHGCFWHSHANCKYAYKPKTRTGFWTLKISSNVERDERNKMALENMGFKVLTVWECELINKPEETLEKLMNTLVKT